MKPETQAVAAQYRQDLSVLAQEYDEKKAASRFIALKAAPIFRTPEFSAGFSIFRRSDFKKRTRNTRAASGSYNRIGGIFGRGTFDTEEYGLEYPLDDREVRRYAKFFDAEQAGLRILHFQMLKEKEIRVATLYANSGSTSHNVATAWPTVATAAPLTDLQAGIDALMDNTGCAQIDISLIMPRADYQELNRVDQFVERFLYTFAPNSGIMPSFLPGANVATVLGIKEVLVANSVYDTKEEGIAETNAQIWTAGVMYLCILADEDAGLEEMSAARTIVNDIDSPGLPNVEAYREENLRRGILREREETDEILQGETDLFIYKLTNT